MSRTNLQPAYRALASTRGHAQVSIQDYHRVTGGHYKVVAAVTGLRSEEDFAQAVAADTDGAARVVPGSMVRDGRIVVAMLAANRRSKPLDDSFTMVTSCTASDHAGQIWSVVNDGSGKRVVIENADDLDAMLADRRAHRTVVANPHEARNLTVASFQNGDAIRYVDPDTSRSAVALGFVCEGEVVAVGFDGKRTRVPSLACVMSAVPTGRQSGPMRRLQAEIATTSLTPTELETAIAFLGKSGILSDEMAERMRALSTSAPAGA